MKTRWMNRRNEVTGENERFYPITHAQAIVYGENEEKTFEDLQNNVTEAIEKADAAMDGINNLTAEDVGAVPVERKVNGKELSGDISLTAEDVGALPIGGGTLSGNLEIEKTNSPIVMVKDTTQGRRGEFMYNTNEEVLISNYKDENNRSLLFLRNENNIENLMQLSRVVNGQWSSYNVYGEHNKPTPADIGAAASSHGNHVPATETANNAKFLRNDNTWQTVTPANIGAAASSHNHGAGEITSGTLGVARGGTGATTFTSGAALIGNGTGAITTRAITDSSSNTAVSGTNLSTCNTVNNHVNARLGRTNSVTDANTAYTTYMARAIAAGTSTPTSLTNGVIYLQY